MSRREGNNYSVIPYERETFDLAGPSYLTSVDWKNPCHCRSVMACLVQGVYVLERDRQYNRTGQQALAFPWWDTFNFRLVQTLVDDMDFSTFGVIYEYKPTLYNDNKTAPKYVVAFRGTINKPDSRLQDLKLDFKCLLNRLHLTSRFRIALQAAHGIAAATGAASNIWITGHSLGSAIALRAGKELTKMGYHIEAYLFNPPFIYNPTERIKDERLKSGIRFTSSVVKAGINAAISLKDRKAKIDIDEEQKGLNELVLLSGWKPYLFVNPGDYICSEYIGYFERRKKMEEQVRAGNIGKIGRTMTSMRGLSSKALGNNAEPFYIVPSAYLTINLTQSPDFKRAHGIHQWWNPDFQFQSTLHQLKQ